MGCVWITLTGSVDWNDKVATANKVVTASYPHKLGFCNDTHLILHYTCTGGHSCYLPDFSWISHLKLCGKDD